jgi:hypothetical protein
MKYTVHWLPEAEGELAKLWLAAENRDSITHAAYELETRLQHDPTKVGESRDRGRRIVLVPPLGALFRVVEDDRTVFVLAAWSFKLR